MIIFQNEGLIDLRGLKTMGLSGKPNTNSPIGYFGTGLKYAISVILKEGGIITLYRGKSKYVFATKQTTFRGETVKIITMNNEELPFTSEYGKNWKPWQAFRELYSNTLDENGRIFPAETPTKGETGKTTIVVEGADFDNLFIKKDNIFLSGTPIFETPTVDVYEGASNAVFYKGMRVMDTKKPTKYTYNIKNHLSLTEDRTAQYGWEASHRIVNAIMSCDSHELISELLNVPRETWESDFDFSDISPASVGETFIKIIANKKAARQTISVSASNLFHKAVTSNESWTGYTSRNPSILENGIYHQAIQKLKSKIVNFPSLELTVLDDESGATVTSKGIKIGTVLFAEGVDQMAQEILIAYSVIQDIGSAEFLTDIIFTGSMALAEKPEPETVQPFKETANSEDLPF